MIVKIPEDISEPIHHNITRIFFDVCAPDELDNVTLEQGLDFSNNILKFIKPSDNLFKIRYFSKDTEKAMKKKFPQDHEVCLTKTDFLSICNNNSKLSLPAINFVLQMFNFRANKHASHTTQ